MPPLGEKNDAVYVDFNQDFTCVCIAHSTGIDVYSIDANHVVFSAPIGAIRLCHMLYSTSLLAYVGAGEQPHLTPRKLSLLNTTTQSVIQDLSFPSSVLAIRMSKTRLVAALEHKAYVYALETLELLSTLDTPGNSMGVCALTTSADPCYLAVPAHAETGVVRIHDAAHGSRVTAELEAHNTKVAALAWNSDGSLLASASTKGTVLRVYSMPQGKELHTLRRGSSQARIHKLQFSAKGITPPLLACASSHGTLHIWVLGAPAAGPGASLLQTVMPSAVTGMISPQRSAATLHIPDGVPVSCAIQKRAPAAASQVLGDASQQGEAVNVFVVSDRAALYVYSVQCLAGSGVPSFSLEDEHLLLQHH